MKRYAATNRSEAAELAAIVDDLSGGPQPGIHMDVPGRRYAPIPKAPDWDAVDAGTAPIPFGWTTQRGAVNAKHEIALPDLTDAQIDDAANAHGLATSETAKLKAALKKAATAAAKLVAEGL